MKIKYLKLKNWLLVSMATLLGLNTACEGSTADEYGCPFSDFHVKGTVTDPDGAPIPGIQVRMDYDVDTTDAEGQYAVQSGRIPGNETVFDVVFSDVDGAENGLFKNDTVPVTFPQSELTGGDGWYEGSATQTLNVTLQRLEE